MFALIPLLVQIIFFLISNGPKVIALLRELRLLMKDLNAADQKALFEQCKSDFDAFKVDKDEVKLMSAINEKRAKFKTMEGPKRGRKNK